MTIFIDHCAKQKLDLYIKHASGEISGFGYVTVLNNKDFFVSDVFILKQECSSSNSDMSQKDVSDMLVELALQDIPMDNIKLYWHSHANMKVFWSGTDVKTIETLSSDDWFLSIVGNKKGELLARLDVSQPIHMFMDDIPVVVREHANPELEQSIVNEIKQKVTTTHYVVATSKKGNVTNGFYAPTRDYLAGTIIDAN